MHWDENRQISIQIKFLLHRYVYDIKWRAWKWMHCNMLVININLFLQHGHFLHARCSIRLCSLWLSSLTVLQQLILLAEKGKRIYLALTFWSNEHSAFYSGNCLTSVIDWKTIDVFLAKLDININNKWKWNRKLQMYNKLYHANYNKRSYDSKYSIDHQKIRFKYKTLLDSMLFS